MRKKVISENREIEYNDTIESIFGKKEDREHLGLRDHPVYKQFQNKFKRIFNIARHYKSPDGETIKLIGHTFGEPLDRIPYGKLDEVEIFIKENIETRDKIITPEIYAYSVQTGYYQKSSTALPSRYLVEKFYPMLASMMEERRPVSDFIQFGIEVSKL